MTRFGRNSTALEIAATADLSGRSVVITGASSGIGRETARAMAATGADVLLGVRDVAKGEQVARDIRPTAAGRVDVAELDLTDLASIDAFAAGVHGPVDVLIANAGLSQTPESHLPNGIDVRFATNHLGHFHLAHQLLGAMSERGARLVVVGSGAHKGNPIHLDDLTWRTRQHSAGKAYAESKTANLLFAQEASRRWAHLGVFANAVLPGSSLTGLQRNHTPEMMLRIGFITADGTPDPTMKTPEQAAATTTWAAVAPELAGVGGLVLEDCGIAKPVGPDWHPWCDYDESVASPELARQLWEATEAIIADLVGELG